MMVSHDFSLINRPTPFPAFIHLDITPKPAASISPQIVNAFQDLLSMSLIPIDPTTIDARLLSSMTSPHDQYSTWSAIDQSDADSEQFHIAYHDALGRGGIVGVGTTAPAAWTDATSPSDVLIRFTLGGMSD